MIEPTNLIISLINLFSLGLGGIALVFIFKLSRSANIKFLHHYFIFLVCAVIAGFCDWIVYNWVRLLVPGVSSVTRDLIYHILWDLIGFPAALFALLFLIKVLYGMLQIKFTRMSNLVLISVFIFFTILSYISLYFRLQEIENIIRNSVVFIFTYVIPFSILFALAFAYFGAQKLKDNKSLSVNFIALHFISFLVWIFLSLAPIHIGIWRHLIIISYYLTLFIPATYLFIKRAVFLVIPKEQAGERLEKTFVLYSFTAREKELVMLLLEGKSNQEISEDLFISLQTVKNYVSKIYKKAGLKNRVQFVNFIQKQL